MATRRSEPPGPPPVDHHRLWRRMWLFGLPVEAPADGLMLVWRDRLDVIRTEVADPAERVEEARRLAYELGFGDDVEAWIAPERWGVSGDR